MRVKTHSNITQQAVSGQAQAIFDILARTGSLPTPLCLTIEEILERAWEIAYHRQAEDAASYARQADCPPNNLVTLSQFKACRRKSPGNSPLS